MKVPLYLTLLLPGALRGAEIVRANNSEPLQTGAAWVGGTAPGPGDTAVWDGTAVQQAGPLDADAHWAGIRVTSGAVQSAVVRTTGSAVLRLGSAGLRSESTAFGIALTGSVALSAGQSWSTAGSAAAAGLRYVSAAPAGGEAAFDFGGNTVTYSGPAPLSFSGGDTGNAVLRHGVLAMVTGEVQISSSARLPEAGALRVLQVRPDFTVQLPAGTALRPFNHHDTAQNLSWNARVELNGGTLSAAGYEVTAGEGRSGPNVLGGAIVAASGTSLIELPPGITAGTAEHWISAAVTGAGGLALRNHSSAAAAHALVLGGDWSGYSGAVTVDASAGRRTVRVRGGAESGNAAWTVAAGNTLELDRCALQVRSLAGGGTVTATGGGGSLLTLDVSTAGSSSSALLTNAPGAALAVRKTGPQTLGLSGFTNSWAGDTIVDQSNLSTGSTQLDDNSTVRIAAGAKLGVSSSFPKDTVTYLYLDGVAQPAGTYSRITHPAYFFGNGVLEVTGGQSLNPYNGWIHGFPKLCSALERDYNADPDGDGMNNYAEFGFSGDPSSAADGGKILATVIDGQPAMIVPIDADLGGAMVSSKELILQRFSGGYYRIQASRDLVNFTTEAVMGVPNWTPPPGLPPLAENRRYRAFRAVDGTAPRMVLRALFTPGFYQP